MQGAWEAFPLAPCSFLRYCFSLKSPPSYNICFPIVILNGHRSPLLFNPKFMSQMTWTYVDDYGTSHKVGLFHGDHSGHLLIYCNTRILVIDFNVLQNKKYSFFINDELFDIHIERTDDHFSYGIEIDRKADTPRNHRRRKRERANLVQLAAISVTLIAVISLMVYFSMHYFS